MQNENLLTYAVVAGLIMGVSSAAINFLANVGANGEMQGRMRRGESTHPMHRTHGGLPFMQEVRSYAGSVQPQHELPTANEYQDPSKVTLTPRTNIYDNSDYLFEDPNEITLDDSEDSEGIDTSF